jgi:hypothetical protein
MTRVILVLMIAAMGLDGQAAGGKRDPLPASVTNVRITRSNPSGPDFVMIGVAFEASVKNDRQTEIRVGSEPVYPTGADLRLETGAWQRNMDLMLLDNEDLKHDKCSRVPPGGAYTLPKVLASVRVRRTGGHLPPSVTARFYLATACKEGEATLFQGIATGPVEIDLSAIPEK